MEKIDLHIHSHFSDGINSPEEILKEAKEAGLKVVAISDHNWPHNMKEKVALAQKFGLESIEALEVNTRHEDTTIHILGYSKDFNDKMLIEGLQTQKKGYEDRRANFIKHINSTGIVTLDINELSEHFKGFHHDFQAIVVAAQKLNKPIMEVEELFKKAFEAPVGDWALETREAIELIHKAGGIAVWAHPMIYARRNTQKTFGKTFEKLLKWGIDGLEARHSEQSDKEEEYLVKLAMEHNLLMTGGSDFHGMLIRPNRTLGKKGPREEDFAKILEKLDQI